MCSSIRPLFLVLGLCMGPLVAAQQTLTARIVDATDGSPLPYATVLLKGTSRGTITNAEGRFRIPLQGEQDSLRISFVGYVTRVVAFTQSLDGTDIRLQRSLMQLEVTEVRPGEDLYARTIAASNWLRRAPALGSKLFFGMETHSDEQAVEVLQAYYNAQSKAAMLTKLDFVQGRVGLAPKDDRHFINFNTARAFALMDIHERYGAFPVAPFAYTNKLKLKADFLAELVSAGSGTDGVDHVRVSPRKDDRKAFTLDLWLVAGTQQVLALELNCQACARHPFVPLLPGGRIDTVDMRYKQTWSTTAPYVPEVMELEYHTTYTGADFTERFHTHAVMHAFDHGKGFIPNLFPRAEGVEEYRMISWMPEDSAFWARMNPPLPTERQLRDQAFIAEHDVRSNAWYNEAGSRYDLLRPIYTAWSPTERLGLWNVNQGWTRREGGVPDPNKVDLRVHLYLSMDTTGGAFRHRSMAVFDELRSYHLAPERPWTRAFLNIYFDLCEQERRSMEEALNAPGMDVHRARTIHAQHSTRLRETLDRLMAQTRNGQARSVMGPWNEMVQGSIGIDNLQLVEAYTQDLELPKQTEEHIQNHLKPGRPELRGGSHMMVNGDRPPPSGQIGIGLTP